MAPMSEIAIFDNFMGIRFAIAHATNTGAVWGVLSGYQYLLVVVRILLILGLSGYLILGKHRARTAIPLMLIVAGALGNVIDIFAYGHVIDMLSFRFWGYSYPIFNIADSAIFIGVAWLLIGSFFEKERASV